MKKKFKSKLILLFVCLASLFLFGGCSLGESLDEVIANRDLKAQVTYYSNGGTFEGTPDKKEMYFTAGSKALDIGNITPTSGTVEITRSNYVFGGWYYAVLDDEGKPVYEDEEKKVLKLGEAVDFSVALQEGDHWFLVAKWSANVKVEVRLSIDDKTASIPAEVKEGEEPVSYQHGDLIITRAYDTRDEVVNPGDGKAPFKHIGKDFTFVEYYTDEACSQLVQWPIKKQENDVVIYAKYIKGDWNVVRTAKDVGDMFNSITAGERYWLVKDIDASSRTIVAKSVFEGEIQGNGHTVSGLKVQKSKITAGSTVSLFGDIGSAAVVENLTLADLTITYSLQSSPVGLYFVCSSIAEGATITNVKLSGTMTVTKAEDHIVTSLTEGYGACLFGGFASDAAYLEGTENKGFTVEGNPADFITVNNL